MKRAGYEWPKATSARLLAIAVAMWGASFPVTELRAAPKYNARSGTIGFTVGSNIPFLKVSGASSAVKGSGDATVTGNAATIRNLRFEVDPTTLKTGMTIRDQHMVEKVFTAEDHSIPRLVLRADQFQATLDASTSKWEGMLRGQLTMRGVTKPISFRAWGEKQGDAAIVNAEGSVKTSEFGVKRISYSGATVNDVVIVKVSNLRLEP